MYLWWWPVACCPRLIPFHECSMLKCQRIHFLISFCSFTLLCELNHIILTVRWQNIHRKINTSSKWILETRITASWIIIIIFYIGFISNEKIKSIKDPISHIFTVIWSVAVINIGIQIIHNRIERKKEMKIKLIQTRTMENTIHHRRRGNPITLNSLYHFASKINEVKLKECTKKKSCAWRNMIKTVS